MTPPTDRKTRSRKNILNAALRMFKRQGYVGSGVDGIMEEAGMTSGAFYGHFESKTDVLGAALVQSFIEDQAAMDGALSESETPEQLIEIMQRYLSSKHCEHVEEGCSIPPLLSDLGRADEETKAQFEEVIQWMVTQFEERSQNEFTRQQILSTLALCFGGLSLARAVKSPALARQILSACRKNLPIQKEK
ncbi:MAG: hypothetical protein CME31_14755 [Gimesia sp.]|jgi:TetR/AcrR family transcriptional repressor of nem operon|nr:hypothetical protein [Gimesia sp.]|tara:strand:+ start:5395 stop:5967 length:573 start_codon:yes stop_codon:yes gene_type:complete